VSEAGDTGTRWLGRSLAPKLFGAFVAVLALASLTTLLVESNLTRSELAARTEELTAEQAFAYRNQLRGEEAGTTRSLTAFVQQVQIEADSARAVLDATSVARASGQFTLAEAFDLVTTEPLLEPPYRDRVSPPPPDPDLLVELGSRGAKRRVVPLEDAEGAATGWGVVYTLPFTDAEQRLVLAVGSALDDEYARDVRGFVGVADVELVVGGMVVGSTFDAPGDGGSRDGWRPASGDLAVAGVQAIDDGDRLIQYLPLTAGDAWGAPAQVGLLLDDPLAPLDARLARFRALMMLLLLVVGAVLALAFSTVMTRPLVRLTRTARRIAGGDLEATFEVTRRDEIGQLAAALERMRRALRAQLLVIGQQADALQEAARRVVGSGDRERQRLAHDLHDGIQQRLVVLRMQVGAARARLRREPSAIDQVADELATAIDDLLDELRETAQALYPSILRDRGLGGALRSLAGRTEVTVDVVLEPDPLPRVDEVVEAGAYFLASEAVTNALKHADAPRIEVRVSREPELVRVEVTDEGRGFDPATLERVGGLQNLRDRVNALGGTLRIVSEPGDGTQVTALLPVTGDVAGGSRIAALEVEEDGGDPSVQIELLGEAELPEDGVGVLLDRPVADRQLPGDGGVPLPGRHPS
jgi:signal transduction histidine kinase